ncbi:MAG: CPBP family intramembrane metalloprotease [Victivallales bacterium]|nr:CPBP family intramembrane metalloprotease [Victivallales bacterium]
MEEDSRIDSPKGENELEIAPSSTESPPVMVSARHRSLLQKCDLGALLLGIVGMILNVMGLSLFLALLPNNSLYLVPGILCSAICSLAIVAGYAIGHKKTGIQWSELIPTAHCGAAQRILTIVLVAILLVIVVLLINLAVTCLFHIDPKTSNPFVTLLDNPDVPSLVLIFIDLVIFTPIYEEILFRLALPRLLGSSFIANLFVSLIFAIFHGVAWGIPGLTVFALTLCYFRYKQDIFTCIGVHALFNLLGALGIFMNCS